MGLFNIFKKKTYELTEKDLKWNKMWELWSGNKAASPYAELMTYQSEVNNGGHDQYFINVENVGDLARDMAVLEGALSATLAANLKRAYEAYLILEEKEGDEQAEAILEQCDDVFYEHEAEINRALEDYAATMVL